MAYFEMTRERIFPLSVMVSLMVTAVGLFLLIDALTGMTSISGSFISRTRATAFYWFFFKYPEGNVSAYAATATSTAPARSIPVLLYHGESASKGNTPVSLFVDQMRALKKNGWQTITTEQFHDFMKNGTTLPDKSFLLTFDDGRRDTFYPFDPIIKDMGYTAVMFVVTGFSTPDDGRPARFYLNKKELQFMLDSGRWELQSHGKMDHFKYNIQSTTDLSQDADTVQGNFLSNKLWKDDADRFETDEEFAERIRTDLALAKQELEQHFGYPIFSFAYPFNDFGPSTVNFPGSAAIIDRVVPTVYAFAFYQHWPANGDSFNYPDPSTYMIKRIEPPLDWNGQDLMRALEAGHAKALPYTATNIGNEWVGIWGDIQKTKTAITLTSRQESSGSTAFLNGSGWWRNYTFTARVDWISGENVSLLARNKNDTDYVACSYLPGSVAIDVTRGVEELRLTRVRYDVPRNDALLGIRVEGQNVQCLVNGAVVVSANFTGHASGGVGFKVWDEKMGVAESTFTDISVRPL